MVIIVSNSALDTLFCIAEISVPKAMATAVALASLQRQEFLVLEIQHPRLLPRLPLPL
jgi:hypothetical protein